ncbi:MAG: DUF1553 domain-containing protein [Fimbriimonadaceae bacterium]|nr:DUF1553 domain-containing protein [Fimbriimonadaceae bacterium]
MRSCRYCPTVLIGLNVVWIGAFALAPTAVPRQEAPMVSFSRQILPLLSDRCFTCHGPDASSRKANLRLDTPEGAFADRGGRWPIVPGKPEDSLVVQRITDPDSPMPPHTSGKSLSAEEKQLITRWISEGAKYGKLWSFEPLPATVDIPKVKGTWPRDDLDRFILDRVNQVGLKPTKPAPLERWLRRVTLDLTGLPPTDAEIVAFEKEKDYEKVVDRLLSSPRFGERMAVDWLDAARYSDSYGYQSDLLMPTWPYRDWVVKAFNDNLPYDQFLTDQIAGDLLPDASRDQILATAFNRLHRQSNEGGSIAQEFKTEYAVDRVSTFGTAFLGLTLGCARCHDHKFDPITQKDFYQLYAYFNSISEYGLILSTEIVPTPSLLLPTPEQEQRLSELKAQVGAAHRTLSEAAQISGDRFRLWIASKPEVKTIPGLIGQFDLDAYTDKFANLTGEKPIGHKIGNPTMVDGVKGKALELDGDNGLVIRGLPAKERWEPFTWSFWISDPRQTGPVVLLHRTGGTDVGFCGFDLMLENGYLTARVMRHWPGNAVSIKSTGQIPKDKWSHIGWSYDGSSRAAGLRLYLDGKPMPTTVVVDKLWKKINAYGDLGPSGGDWSFGQRFRDAGFKGGKIDEVAFANRALSDIEVAQLFDGKSLTDPKADLRDFFVAAVDPQVIAARAALQKAQQNLTEFEEGIREISVMEEAMPEVPAYLLARGAYDAPKERVSRGVPASLPPLKSGNTDRLDLAKWATQPDHPLTARVAVNRLWQMIFGVGIVETSDNFGMQGSQPSHQELLDFLARRFVNEGWDVKKTLKHIVLSATYRQDSVRPKNSTASQIDPLNRLYSRGPSNRLTAEMIRDTALAASGLLNQKQGGPPVNAYQPAGIWTENNSMTPGFVQSTGTDLYRRSLYSTWKRTTPVPSMMMFDATSREACSMRRPSTNTPLQALVLLNDIQFVEAARVLAEKTLEQNKGFDFAFLRLAGRKATAAETAVLRRTLKEQREVFAQDPSAAAKLIAVGASKANPALNAVELAAMTVVVQTILNSDAVIWKR